MPLIKTVYPSCGGTVHIFNDHVPKTEAERAKRQSETEAVCLRVIQETVDAIGIDETIRRLMDAKEMIAKL